MAKKSAKKKPNQPKLIQNRRARHDYNLDGSFVVGIALTGAETKALRKGHGQLRGSYVTIKDNELWLINSTISGMPGIPIADDAQTRTRKLLAKRKEIDQLIQLKHQGQTIVPLEVLTQGRFIKVRISAGRGKKLYDKRQTLKARAETKEARSMIKEKSRA